MPVVATPGTPIVVTIDEVRRYMRDRPDTNELLGTVDFTQDEINQGVEMIVSSYNTISPVSYIDAAGWPAAGKYLLLLGVAWYLIQSICFQQVRNQMTYQDGDIAPIGVSDKFPFYMQLWQTLQGEWKATATTMKTQLNYEAAYGGVSSGYRSVYGYR